jgi:hypothetical protein
MLGWTNNVWVPLTPPGRLRGSVTPSYRQSSIFLKVYTMQIGFTYRNLLLTVGKRYA